MKSNSKDELLLTQELAAKWKELLQELRDEPDQVKRDRLFLFMHGWLRGLADAGKLGMQDLVELRELGIRAAGRKLKGTRLA